jgi:hypothetical protein
LGWFKRGRVLKNKPKGEEDETWSFFGRRIGELEVFAVENHRLCCDITHIFNVVLGFFSTKLRIML